MQDWPVVCWDLVGHLATAKPAATAREHWGSRNESRINQFKEDLTAEADWPLW